MKILFLYSQYNVLNSSAPLESLDEMNFGISYISAALKDAGFETKMLVLSSTYGDDGVSMVMDEIKSYKPGMVCFTSVCTQYFYLRKIAEKIKKNFPNIYTVIGGPHPSLNAGKVVRDAFDFVCVGEGERSAVELANRLSRGLPAYDVPNMWYVRDGELKKNPPSEFIQELDELPWPDRDMWLPWVNKDTNVKASVLLGRGCPYNCTYCCNHAFKKLASGKYVRLREPQKIFEEIKYLTLEMGMKEFHLEVETIGVNLDWLFELCELLEKFNATLDSPPEYGTNFRVMPGREYDEIFQKMSAAGFKYMNIGLESGSDRIRREVMKRIYSNDDIVKAVTTARKYGIRSCLFVLMGLPTETEADFLETVKVLRDCQPDRYLLYLFYPYPGTEIYDKLLAKGEITDDYIDVVERIQPALNLPGFPPKMIEKYRVWLDYYVYKGHRPLPKLLFSVLKRKVPKNSFAGKMVMNLLAIYRRLK